MRVLYHEDCLLHDPPYEILSGKLVPYFESPSRFTIIKAELEERGFDLSDEIDESLDLKEHALRIHDAEYLDYLENAYENWVESGGDETAVLPETFPHVSWLSSAPENIRDLSPIAKAGMFCFDLSCPITKDTHRAITASLRVTLTAASLLSSTAGNGVFALCRPPGHHAMPSVCGGYCFMNNVAIAARFLQDRRSTTHSTKPKIAILDIDYHHGNGTQAAFYEDPTILYVSLHAANDYPYFSGSVEENGRHDGKGFNINLPLPRSSTGDNEYCATLTNASEIVKSFGPEFLVVSLGVDTHIDDPISDFKLTTGGYVRVGRIIGGIRRPTLFVMEGGYDLKSIGKNVANVLTGFEDEM